MNLGYSKGETIAAVGGADLPVRLDFHEDRGDEWQLVLRYAGRSYRLSWQLENFALRWLDDATPMSSIWLEKWISSLLEDMSVGLPYRRLTPLEQKLLDAVAASTLTFREYPIRDIGLRAAIGKPLQADYEAAVVRLSSRYLRCLSPVRCFEASLAGLLASSEAGFVRRILDTALACLRERYGTDPEFPSFTLDEVMTHGNLEATARHSVYRVIELARLNEGGGGSVTATSVTFQWATPRDIEHIAECGNTDSFLEYVRNDERCRTECTAPFRLPNERTITLPPPQLILPTGRWLGRTKAPCVVVLLPRGLVRIDDIAYLASSSWAVTLHYLSYEIDKREGGTHFHSSYRESWLRRPETQYAKLGIPPGDHLYALHALELAMDFRDRRPDEPSRHILERDSHDVRLLEASTDLFAAELDPTDIQAGECRDLALGFEKLAEDSWDVRTAEVTFLRAASLAARALGPSHFVTDRLQQLGKFPPEAPRRENALAASTLMWSLSQDLVDPRAVPSSSNSTPPIAAPTVFPTTVMLSTPVATGATPLPADVAILIALEEEWEVFWPIAGEPGGVKDDSGGYLYHFEVPSLGQPYRCVALFMGAMGPGQATQATARLLATRPKTLVNLGIAAAIHDDLKLCDVVVAEQVDDFLSTVKAVPEGTGLWAFELRGSVYRTTHALVQDLTNLKFAHRDAFNRWRSACALAMAERAGQLGKALAAKHLREAPAITKVHLASGPVLAAAEAFSEWLRTRDGLLKALEMEAAGMMLSAHQQADPARTLVLRGISDFGDERKAQTDRDSGGAFRHLAMFNATQLLWAMMYQGLLPRHAPTGDATTGSRSPPITDTPGEPATPIRSATPPPGAMPANDRASTLRTGSRVEMDGLIPPVKRETVPQEPTVSREVDYAIGVARRTISGEAELIRGPNFLAAKLACWQSLRDETLRKAVRSPAYLRVKSPTHHTTDEFALRRLCLQLSERYPEDIIILNVSELLDGESERAQRARSILLEYLPCAKLGNLSQNLHIGALYDLAEAPTRYGIQVRAAVEEALSQVLRSRP